MDCSYVWRSRRPASAVGAIEPMSLGLLHVLASAEGAIELVDCCMCSRQSFNSFA